VPVSLARDLGFSTPRSFATLRPICTSGSGSRRFMFGGGSTVASATELPYPSELPSGSVDASTHPDDIYWFYMDTLAEMDFALSPETTTSQVALRVYDDNGTDIVGREPLLSDESFTYDHAMGFVAPRDGYYLLDVHAVSGATTYTVPYDWYYGPNDDISWIPGHLAPEITAPPVSEWLDHDWDPDDVYRVPLRAGDTLTLNLDADYAHATPDFDLDLFLLGPGQTSVDPHTLDNSNNVAWSAHAAPAVESIVYTAPTTGNYFVDVEATAGAGPSILTWGVNPVRPSIWRTPAAAKLSYKRKKRVAKFALGACVTDQYGVPLADVRLYLQTSQNGKRWKNLFALDTNTGGWVSRVIAKTKIGSTYYRWYRPWSATSKSAVSLSQKVSIR
jgi:hypothetical protein